jgi:arginyl-tRNA synthetase
MTTSHQHINDPIKAALCESLITILTDQQVTSVDKDQLYDLIEQPPEYEMGDYALPCFQFAKILRKNPKDIATNLQQQLEATDNKWVIKTQTVGAFLNIFINKKSLAQFVIKSVFDKTFFQKKHKQSERIMVEYSQPNTHKEFHIGHTRNVCLGDSLCRLFDYEGYEVIPVNYIGDEGTHVAKCLWQIKTSKQNLPSKDQVKWYGKQYALANQKIKESSEEERKQIQQDLSKILTNLENKSGDDYNLWQKTRQDCLEDFNRIYKWIDAKFAHFFYESEVSQESQNIVEEYIKKDIFTESQGAYGIDLEEYNLGFFMARKSDGTTLYITKDLALARKKFEQFNIDRSINVVGSEQKFHFQQLFKALEIMGFEQANKCYHLSYGHVVLSSGKMSSRLGNTFTCQDLIDNTLSDLEKKLERYQDSWSIEEISDTSHKLAVGAIRYGMLSSDPNKEIVYDPENWISFEGNSGPYLSYSYSRAKSILRKSNQENILFPQNFEIEYDIEKQLVRYLYDFNTVVSKSCQQYKPSILAHYLYDTCKCFNKMYAQIKILESSNKESKLALLKSFAIILKQGLYLLGITPPEKM